jgi:uncharacterized protein YdiU (UPF0061 family)
MTPDTSSQAGWRLDASYAQLPASFFVRQQPEPVARPQLVILNTVLAVELGLALTQQDAATQLSGNALPPGADPIAQAYAGHQFGHFTMLGDGRAVLLGEQQTPDGRRVDIQLKGSGRTPFSRQGDGRAALGPMLREYIISEAMQALGIPTTRSLAVVTSGGLVSRETMQPGAVLARVASSHIRVGTFEYASMQRDRAALQALADYTIQRHFPELAHAEQPHVSLLRAVMQRQAGLVARWMQVGFIHGVMNTDNMALSGETIDYGPCAFMDAYDPMTVFSSIDMQGRYAFGNQPLIAQWNLARLAETLLPLLHNDIDQAIVLAEAALAEFPIHFRAAWQKLMGHKLGLFDVRAGDEALLTVLLALMHEFQADYTNSFRALSADKMPSEPLFQDARFHDWHKQWQARLASQSQSSEEARDLMCRNSPALIPRNHQVEAALRAAEQGEYSQLHRLLAALAQPYADDPTYSAYSQPPTEDEKVRQTFCGT